MNDDKNKPSLQSLTQAVMQGDVQKAQAIALARSRADIEEAAASGTPLSLHEAVTRAMMFGPMSGTPERIHAAVRDFLAQKMSAVILLPHSDETKEVLKDLWTRMTGEVMK